VENIEATNLGPLLADASQEITLFAPTNEAWEALDALDVSVDLDDRQTLQSIMTYLVVTGSVNLPASVRSFCL
jgi:transforming growth factor-beta-induced protein